GDADQIATEVQLAALQEQLVAVMLDNQHLNDELKSLRDTGMIEQLRQQLDREKEKSRILMDRLQERDSKDKDHGERETRERERHPREKSLPPGDKSPSLPQRIRKRINQMHKSQSFDVEDGSPGPPASTLNPSLAPTSVDKTRLVIEERSHYIRGGGLGGSIDSPAFHHTVKYGEESTPVKSTSSFDVVESPSRGRFVWKRRGLEKSKSLDQSEFLASLNGPSSGHGVSGGSTTPSAEWLDEDHRRESDSDDPDREKGDAGGHGSDSDPGSLGGGISSGVVVSPKDPLWKRMEIRIVSFVRELMKDFSEVAEEEQPDGDPEGDPLTVKKLKENILRFGCVMRPLTELSAVVQSLLRWESPSATLLALVVYLYCVVFGWVLTLILVLAIMRLSVNYLKKRGWTETMFRRLRREGGEAIENPGGEAGLGDKFALVLQVARRVQNQLGAVSNAAEKCKNLLLWEHEATSRLYACLWIVLLASVLLPSSQLFTLTGVYLGLKFFVMDYVFFRYPRIRQKYDTTSRLWDTLPTDADLERRGDKTRNDNGNSSPDLTSFLELFNLPATESPLPGWQSGRRCTLVNRDRSLTSAFKNGRLYLTNRLAKQDKQANSSSSKLNVCTNKISSSSSSNKLAPASSASRGNIVKKSPIMSISKGTEASKKTALPGFSKNHNEANSSSASSFSFLGKGNKSSKAKDVQESKEEEELDFLASIFAQSDSSEPIDPSMMFLLCEKAKESSKTGRSKGNDIPDFKSSVYSDSQQEDSRSFIAPGRRKMLLRSVSEISETPPELSGDEDVKAYHSSPDIKRHSDKDPPVRDAEAKSKKSKLRMKTNVSFEHKSKPSVIDKLNDRVFFAV
ncbi:GRAM domain-containing protein 4, partial [Halocaridina rubra]